MYLYRINDNSFEKFSQTCFTLNTFSQINCVCLTNLLQPFYKEPWSKFLDRKIFYMIKTSLTMLLFKNSFDNKLIILIVNL